MRRLALAATLLLLAPLASAQQIYKWTDAKGTVHYSQSAPPQGTKFQQVKLASGVESAANTAAEQPAATDDDNAAAPAAPAPTAVADTPANRAKLCATLQSNLATLRGSAPVVTQSGGQSVVMSAAQRQQQIATANAQYQQYCAAK